MINVNLKSAMYIKSCTNDKAFVFSLMQNDIQPNTNAKRTSNCLKREHYLRLFAQINDRVPKEFADVITGLSELEESGNREMDRLNSRFSNTTEKMTYGAVHWLNLMLSFSETPALMIKGALCVFIKESGDCQVFS